MDEDRLDDLRATLAAQRAYEAEHGFLYDAPAVDPDDLAWAIAEIERLRSAEPVSRPLALPPVVPGVCVVCGDCAAGFTDGSSYWHTHATDCTGPAAGGRLLVDSAVRQLLDLLDAGGQQ